MASGLAMFYDPTKIAPGGKEENCAIRLLPVASEPPPRDMADIRLAPEGEGNRAPPR